MWQRCNILLLFAILCIDFGTQALVQRSFKKEWKFRKHAIFKYGRPIAMEDNSFLFAVCSKEKLPMQMNCNVTLETPILHWDSGKSRKESCRLKLIGSKDHGERHEITSIASLQRLGTNQALLVWWQRRKDSQYQIHQIVVTIVSLTNCTVQHLYFPVDVEKRVLLSNVVIYPYGFDVIVTNEKMCGDSMSCRISHDLQGQRLAGSPASFTPHLDTVHTLPVAGNSSERGFYVYGTDVASWKFRAIYLSPSGQATNLMTASGVSDPTQLLRATSNAHGMYGICLMGDKKIHCAQFDDEATVRMNASVKFSGVVQWLDTYNVVNNQSLLIMGHCNNQKCRNFKVVAIKADGSYDEAIEVPDLNLKCSEVSDNLTVSIAEYGDDFCFYFACTYEQEVEGKGFKSSVKFSAKCVPKNQFKFQY